MTPHSIIITPPLMQLNAPYPSGAYLNSFFKKRGFASKWYDLSIKLFYSIFSKSGLTLLFEKTSDKALSLAQNAENNGDEPTAFNLRRYVSTKDSWISWIDYITGMLCSSKDGFSGREKAHQFLYSPFAPRGSHMENYLSSLNHDPSVDDVRFLCTFALADLADYITMVLDQNFSLIRYAEALAVDERSFLEIEKQINSPVLEIFYLPVLEKEFGEDLDLLFSDSIGDKVEATAESTTDEKSFGDKKSTIDEKGKEEAFNKTIVCISVPFAGTFLSALYTALYFKRKYKDKVLVGIGGGFVNTELREASDKALAKYIDFISYDRGYGSFDAYLDYLCSKNTVNDFNEFIDNENSNEKCNGLYKTRLFFNDGTVINPIWKDKKRQVYEENMTRTNTPDYTDIDFSIYPRLCDDENPMHRIWSDGAWIKAYLAHGCYWAKCAFCDTQLDYVCGYKITDIENLYKSLLKTAKEKGVYGIHFVDEALPPTALIKFAILNAREGNPLYYWGNVRFEKSFTKDLAAFLSYCGLGAVSAGIEVATGEGLKEINKGTDIKSIVASCAAFKEAGILVHAYMIYGFWYDSAQSIIDSMETLRQFFASGLLDSAFWHKFVLTRNSTVYAKWEKEGKLDMVTGKDQSSCFAKNNLHFKGENKFNKFGNPLDSAVSAWMHNLKMETKVTKWFDFQVPQPRIKKNFIDGFIEEYERMSQKVDVDYERTNEFSGPFWLGQNVIECNNKIRWMYLQEDMEMNIKKDKEKLIKVLSLLKPECPFEKRKEGLNLIKKDKELQNLLLKLHNIGLVFI